MFLSLRSLLSVVAAATLFFVSTGSELRAQVGERSRSDQVTLGNNYVGVDIVGWARARSTGIERRVDEAAWTMLRLMNATVEMQRIAATAIRTSSGFSASTSFRRGGFTVRNDVLIASGTVAFTSTANVFAIPRAATTFIFGIPITVAANVSHTAVMNQSLIDVPSVDGCVLNGRMESHAFGFAGATTVVPGVLVAVQTELRLGSQRFQGALGAFPATLSTATLTYDLSAPRLFLKVLLDVGFFHGEAILVDASAAARHFAPFLP